MSYYLYIALTSVWKYFHRFEILIIFYNFLNSSVLDNVSLLFFWINIPSWYETLCGKQLKIGGNLVLECNLKSNNSFHEYYVLNYKTL